MLLRAQHGKCARCGLFFRDSDLLEVDHVVPLSEGGFDRYDNRQLLHRHCHDTNTAGDRTPAAKRPDVCTEPGHYGIPDDRGQSHATPSTPSESPSTFSDPRTAP
jgi:hypothetical protein